MCLSLLAVKKDQVKREQGCGMVIHGHGEDCQQCITLRSGKEKKISQMIPGIRISVVELFEFEELRHMFYEGQDLDRVNSTI